MRASGQALLRTKGGLALTFVGTGSAFSKKLYQNNLLVAKGRDHLLVDCGTRTPEALELLGLSVVKIDAYLVTHSHADHIGGLEEVMLVNRYGARRKPRIVVTDKLKRILWSQSLRGGAAWNERHRGQELGFDDFWIQEKPGRLRGGDRELCFAKVGDIGIHLFRTKHIPDSARGWEDSFPSYGLVLDGRILFTGDTRYDPDLLAWATRTFPIEAIFHDVQAFTGGVHAGIDEIAGLPAAIKAKTRLMHYGDQARGLAAKARKLGFAGLAEQWRTYSFGT